MQLLKVRLQKRKTFPKLADSTFVCHGVNIQFHWTQWS